MSDHSPSRLLTRLELAISSEADRVRADCLRAEYAAELSRRRQLSMAELLLGDLRRRYSDRPDNLVIAWINYAESMLEHGNGIAQLSLSKMRRAHALAESMRIRDLQGITAATLSYIYWNDQNVDAAIRYLKESLRLATPRDHSILCRASLVLADMFGMSRRNDLAQPWFSVARTNAIASMDDASLSSLAFNLATLSLMMLRQSVLSQRKNDSTQTAATFRIKASSNVNAIFGIVPSDLTLIHRAQLYSLAGKSDEAMALYKVASREHLVSSGRQSAEWISDEAWCQARLGEFSEANRLAQESESLIVAETQLDDRAALYSRLGSVYEILGDHDKALDSSARAEKLWREYEIFQDDCFALIEEFSDTKAVLKID